MGIEAEIGDFGVQRLAHHGEMAQHVLAVFALQQRPCAIARQALQLSRHVDAQVHHEATLAHEAAVAGIEHGAATGGDDALPAGEQFHQGRGLARAKARFAFAFEDRRHAGAGVRLDLAVDVGERQPEAFGQPSPDRGLSGPHGADQDEIGCRLHVRDLNNRRTRRRCDNRSMNDPLQTEALATFATLFDEALAAGEPDRTAMVLATATRDARPSARTVLLKAHDERGFVFYTHLDGRKGRELQVNPQAALLFHWPRVRHGVQVRIEGAVAVVADAEADAYFASRPRGSQLGAWASLQSETLEARENFEARIERYAREFDGRDVPRPPRWTGFRVVPRTIEFWYGAEYRLHERWLYERDAGGWTKRMLYP